MPRLRGSAGTRLPETLGPASCAGHVSKMNAQRLGQMSLAFPAKPDGTKISVVKSIEPDAFKPNVLRGDYIQSDGTEGWVRLEDTVCNKYVRGRPDLRG